MPRTPRAHRHCPRTAAPDLPAYRTGGVWLLTIRFFPLGLVFFIAGRRPDTLAVVIAADSHGGSRVPASGEVPRHIASSPAGLATTATPGV